MNDRGKSLMNDSFQSFPSFPVLRESVKEPFGRLKKLEVRLEPGSLSKESHGSHRGSQCLLFSSHLFLEVFPGTLLLSCLGVSTDNRETDQEAKRNNGVSYRRILNDLISSYNTWVSTETDHVPKLNQTLTIRDLIK